MDELIHGKATICIINYKTLDFTRLCLRSIRKFTKYPCEVLVIDNDSNDESLGYLRSLDWIRLIERQTIDGESGGEAHARALDLGLENCNTEFFISMHTDTFVTHEGWLSELIAYFGNDNDVACVGSGKIELTPAWREWLKAATDFKTFKRKLLKTPDPLGKHRYYNRTICALYRTQILGKEGLTFTMHQDKGLTAGKKLYFELVDRGYKTVELRPTLMGRYVIHLAHATQVINPAEFKLRNKTMRKTSRLIDKIMNMATIQEVRNDDSLDK